MSNMKEILEKFQDFSQFLNGVDLESMRKNHTRQELKEFSKQLYDVKIRSLAYEINKITDEMKKEEFPQLLAVHRYPIINEMDFLNEQQKIDLDKFLGSLRKGNYVNSLWRITSNQEKVKQIENFLIEKGIIDESFVVMCPNCSDEHISNMMTREEKTKLEELLKVEPSYDRYEALEEFIRYGCDECSYEVNYDKLDNDSIRFKTYLKLVEERDKSLDNV